MAMQVTPVTSPVTVVLADDHPMFRYGLRAVLDDAPEIEVVGEAASSAGKQVRPLKRDLNLTGGRTFTTTLPSSPTGGSAATR
jgi:hypothetical protein